MNQRLKGARNQSRGATGEIIALGALKYLGYKNIKKIHNAWRVHRRGGKIVGASPETKVDGDFRAVGPAGRSVLVEVKHTTDDRLTYSTLETHQHRNLYEHHEAGGLSLLVWVYGGEPKVMAYPVKGFKPRTSISLERAAELDMLTPLDGSA